jgi:hypothetical protein
MGRIAGLIVSATSSASAAFSVTIGRVHTTLRR